MCTFFVLFTQTHLCQWEGQVDHSQVFFRHHTLCETLGGNAVPLLTITSQPHSRLKEDLEEFCKCIKTASVSLLAAKVFLFQLSELSLAFDLPPPPPPPKIIGFLNCMCECIYILMHYVHAIVCFEFKFVEICALCLISKIVFNPQHFLLLGSRPYIFLTGRVHPGESNSSWVMKGKRFLVIISLQIIFGLFYCIHTLIHMYKCPF